MPYNFDDYLNVVKQNIKNKKLHAPICDELESHLQDSADFYVEIGYDAETSRKKALEDMGEPAVVGESMAKLHKLSVGQVITEVLFIVFALLKLFEIVWLNLAFMIGDWIYILDAPTMLCLTFTGFLLALLHKRLLPAAISLLCIFADVLEIFSVFYVVIIHLSGGWKEYLNELEFSSGYSIISANKPICIVTAVFTVLTLGVIVFTFMRIRQYIKTPVKMSLQFTKIFYTVSISILCLTLVLSVATKYYAYQNDIKEKAEFDKVVATLCDYCLEKEKVTAEDVDDLISRFDYLDFTKEACDGQCGHYSGDNAFHYMAYLGDKSVGNPVLYIAVYENSVVDIHAEHELLFDYYSPNPFLLLRLFNSNYVWSEDKYSKENGMQNCELLIAEDDFMKLKFAEASKFTDIIKKYGLIFEYTYDAENDSVAICTKTDTGGLFGLHYYWVEVKDGIITETEFIHD